MMQTCRARVRAPTKRERSSSARPRRALTQPQQNLQQLQEKMSMVIMNALVLFCSRTVRYAKFLQSNQTMNKPACRIFRSDMASEPTSEVCDAPIFGERHASERSDARIFHFSRASEASDANKKCSDAGQNEKIRR